MGWSNPKKAAYNRLYNMTTASPIDSVLDAPKSNRISRPTTEILQSDYESKANALSIYRRGLTQCEISTALIGYIKDDILNDGPMHKAIRRLHNYVLGYTNKPISCGFDYCEMCNERLLKLQRINPEVKEICLNIVECTRIGVSADDIFVTLSSNKALNLLINEHKVVENSITKEASHIPLFTPITSPSHQYQQPTKKDLQTWKVVLRYIGVIVGFILLIWIIAEFLTPAILVVLILISFLFAKN